MRENGWLVSKQCGDSIFTVFVFLVLRVTALYKLLPISNYVIIMQIWPSDAYCGENAMQHSTPDLHLNQEVRDDYRVDSPRYFAWWPSIFSDEIYRGLPMCITISRAMWRSLVVGPTSLLGCPSSPISVSQITPAPACPNSTRNRCSTSLNLGKRRRNAKKL